MHRVNFHLTKQQHDRLLEVSKQTGLPMSEIVRRAVDFYLSIPPRSHTEIPKEMRGGKR
jgi:hypothetical protein